MTTPETLARSPLLGNLPAEALVGLAAVARRRSYRRGEVVFHQGDPGDTLHLLQVGRVKVYLAGESGDEAVIAILVPGDSFGELSLLDGEPRSATIEALEPVETVSVTRADFTRFLRANPPAM